MTSVPLYDAFAQDYDRFVNWEARLAFELPFFRALLATHGVSRVLDVACGTGQHAIALAREGYAVTGVDLSSAMVLRARENAERAGVSPAFSAVGFGALAQTLHDSFDAVLCLGNSIPHLTSDMSLQQALVDFRAVLRPGGILVVQNRNFDRILQKQERFIAPQSHRDGSQEWMFFRFYDFVERLLRFNVVRLYQPGDGKWVARVEQTDLYPWQHGEMIEHLRRAGFHLIETYGSYGRDPFDPTNSGDLVLVARRPKD